MGPSTATLPTSTSHTGSFLSCAGGGGCSRCCPVRERPVRERLVGRCRGAPGRTAGGCCRAQECPASSRAAECSSLSVRTRQCPSAPVGGALVMLTAASPTAAAGIDSFWSVLRAQGAGTSSDRAVVGVPAHWESVVVVGAHHCVGRRFGGADGGVADRRRHQR